METIFEIFQKPIMPLDGTVNLLVNRILEKKSKKKVFQGKIYVFPV